MVLYFVVLRFYAYRLKQPVRVLSEIRLTSFVGDLVTHDYT